MSLTHLEQASYTAFLGSPLDSKCPHIVDKSTISEIMWNHHHIYDSLWEKLHQGSSVSNKWLRHDFSFCWEQLWWIKVFPSRLYRQAIYYHFEKIHCNSKWMESNDIHIFSLHPFPPFFLKTLKILKELMRGATV